MSIPHLENLNVNDFIHVIENIDDYIIMEKLDGQYCLCGIEDDGRLYIKGHGTVKYYADTYKKELNREIKHAGLLNTFNVLLEIEEELRSVLSNEIAVEIEILNGPQPNAILYGSNRLVFLRFVSPKQVDEKLLSTFTTRQCVVVPTKHSTTTNGIDVVSTVANEKWYLSTVPYINTLKFPTIDLTTLKQWLSNIHTTSGMTYNKVINSNLNLVQKSLRPVVGEFRSELKAFVKEHYMLPIKKQIVDAIICNKPSMFCDLTDISPNLFTGIEGIVLRHSTTHKMVKVINSFTTINRHNFSVRGMIFANNSDPFVPSLREELMGIMWAINTGLDSEFITNFNVRISQAIKAHHHLLQWYIDNKSTFNYSPHIDARTLLYFAEIDEKLNRLQRLLSHKATKQENIQHMHDVFGSSVIRLINTV